MGGTEGRGSTLRHWRRGRIRGQASMSQALIRSDRSPISDGQSNIQALLLEFQVEALSLCRAYVLDDEVLGGGMCCR